MRLATILTPEGARAVRLDGELLTLLDAPDLSALLADEQWLQRAAVTGGKRLKLTEVQFLPVLPRPAKIVCVGHNYRSHILELGRDEPDYPTLFSKLPSSLLGAYDDLILTRASDQVDWEVELCVVIGRQLRRATKAEAQRALGAYTIMNDISMRDWQSRTSQWFQGKNFERSTPLGPYLVTPDELDPARLELLCAVDGTVVQRANTSDLLFSPAELASYVSQFVTLFPGDLIATGTPGGTGMASDPASFLTEGCVLTSAIEGLGECRNRCVRAREGEP